jgi:hypothetical protein
MTPRQLAPELAQLRAELSSILMLLDRRPNQRPANPPAGEQGVVAEVFAMTPPRGYRDLYQRLRGLPGRVWCIAIHKRLWKVWRIGYAHHGGVTSMVFCCRRCGRQYQEWGNEGSDIHVMLANRFYATVDQKHRLRGGRSTEIHGYPRRVSTVSIIQV